MNPKLKYYLQVILGWVTIGVVAVIIRSCFCSGGDEVVKTVKHGNLQACQSYTVEVLVNSFIDKPKWEHIVAADGKDYVNIRGKVVFNEKKANLTLQFLVVGSNFEFNALEINDVPKNEIAGELVTKMCEAAANR